MMFLPFLSMILIIFFFFFENILKQETRTQCLVLRKLEEKKIKRKSRSKIKNKFKVNKLFLYIISNSVILF